MNRFQERLAVGGGALLLGIGALGVAEGMSERPFNRGKIALGLTIVVMGGASIVDSIRHHRLACRSKAGDDQALRLLIRRSRKKRLWGRRLGGGMVAGMLFLLAAIGVAEEKVTPVMWLMATGSILLGIFVLFVSWRA